MGSKYKKALELKWKGKSLTDVKLKTLQSKTDDNISNVLKGKFKRRGLR